MVRIMVVSVPTSAAETKRLIQKSAIKMTNSVGISIGRAAQIMVKPILRRGYQAHLRFRMNSKMMQAAATPKHSAMVLMERAVRISCISFARSAICWPGLPGAMGLFG